MRQLSLRGLRTFRSEPDRVRDGLIAVVVLAAVAAGWFGWSWWSAAHDDGLALARERDTVLRVAQEALVTLNSVDYRTAKHDLGQWAEVTTGRFGAELADQREEQVRQVTESETVATATVASASVAELRPRKGSARVLAVLDIDVRAADTRSGSRHSLLEVELTDTDSGWKIASVQAAR